MIKKTIVKTKSAKTATVKDKSAKVKAAKDNVESVATKKSKAPSLKSKKVSDTKVKRFCKWKKKHFADKFDEYSALVTPVTYICTKCGRGASDKKYLCKPEKIKL